MKDRFKYDQERTCPVFAAGPNAKTIYLARVVVRTRTPINNTIFTSPGVGVHAGHCVSVELQRCRHGHRLRNPPVKEK